VVSSSGIGDGMYPMDVMMDGDKVVGIKITYLDDEYEEDEEEEFDNEENED
jgi:hypothetical protein